MKSGAPEGLAVHAPLHGTRHVTLVNIVFYLGQTHATIFSHSAIRTDEIQHEYIFLKSL